MFEYPTHYRYRTMRFLQPAMVGVDVYALQTALKGLGSNPGPFDGIFGQQTRGSVVAVQKALKLEPDGLVGPTTQITICRRLTKRVETNRELPVKLAFGQVSHEASCILGNYSDMREDGSYDAGITQRNTAYTHPQEAFDVVASIRKLGWHLRDYFDRFVGVSDLRRRWELAAGSWNAPAYAGWIANEEGASVPRGNTREPSDFARQKLEEYMKSATAHMQI